jgi:hypothetical protein
VAAGLPTGAGLLDGLLEELERRGDPRLFNSMTYIVAVYSNWLNEITHGKMSGPDIESIVSAVEMLAGVDELEIRPFIRDLSAGRAMKNIDGRDYPNFSLLDFNRQAEMRELYYEMRRILRELLAVSPSTDVRYLYPFVNLARDDDITVATLNYDGTVEKAADESGVSWSHGIDQWNDQWQLAWQSPGLRLMKLHGSLEWEDRFSPPSNLSPGGSIVDRSMESGSGSFPYIVFGRREKLRPSGPFLDLRTAFISDLRVTTHLVVVGYSFGDEHVNEVIRHWLAVDVNRILVVVDPAFPENHFHTPNPFIWNLFTTLQERPTALVRHITKSRLLPLRLKFDEVMDIVCQGALRIDEELAQSIRISKA